MSKKIGMKNSLLHLEILADHPLLNYRGTDNKRGAFLRSSFVRYRLWLRPARLYVTNTNILYQHVLRAEGARKIIASIICQKRKNTTIQRHRKSHAVPIQRHRQCRNNFIREGIKNKGIYSLVPPLLLPLTQIRQCSLLLVSYYYFLRAEWVREFFVSFLSKSRKRCSAVAYKLPCCIALIGVSMYCPLI